MSVYSLVAFALSAALLGCAHDRRVSTVDSTPVVDAGTRPIATPPPLDVLSPMGAVPKAELERFAREAERLPPGTMQRPPPPDPIRDEAIRARFGSECVLERTCGPLWGINCRAEVDGPYFYVRPRPDRLEEITTCGGACMGGRCTKCPPKEDGWTCPVF